VNHDADTTIHLAEILGGAPCRRAYYCTVLRDGRPTRLEYTENNPCCQRFEVAPTRRADRCDFAISAELLDPGSVNLTERWSRKRRSKPPQERPSNEQPAAMLSVSVAEYDIAEVRPLSGKGRA
jgi:hypothetical protein